MASTNDSDIGALQAGGASANANNADIGALQAEAAAAPTTVGDDVGGWFMPEIESVDTPDR